MRKMTGNEFDTLVDYFDSQVASQRYRYSKQQWTTLLQEHRVNEVSHVDVLDGLALITIATF